MILTNINEIKAHFDALNGDLSHYANSNDICTPIDCVMEMVDAIPQELWVRPNLRILDPCCGNGNFGAYLATKTSLSNIYFNEISDARVKNLKSYFGEDINLTQKDFLEFPTPASPTEKYDLIIANPPYAQFTIDGKRASKNHNMSRAFVSKALELVADNGYLVFIIPNNWMSYADRNPLPSQLTALQPLTIDINGAKKWFPKVGSSFTWFVIKNSPTSTTSASPTTIHNHYFINDTQTAKLPPRMPCLPLYLSDDTLSIFAKTVFDPTLPKYKVLTTSYLHKYTKRSHIVDAPDTSHPYRLIHTPSQTVYSDIPHKYQEGWKVFIPTTNKFEPFVDCNCGMTQSIAFILCENEAEARRICGELSDEVYLFVNDTTRYGNFNCNRVLERLPVAGSFTLSESEKETIRRFLAAEGKR